MSKFEIDQKVHVEFDGTVTGYDNGWLVVQADTTRFLYKIWRDAAEKVVTRREPEYWPPQAGDIWEADGLEYYGYTGVSDTVRLLPMSLEAGEILSLGNLDNVDTFKAMNPTLKRRRGMDL